MQILQSKLINEKPPVVSYVDYTIPGILAGLPMGERKVARESQSIQIIWQHFTEGNLELVTSLEDTKMDLILYLNRQGCCVTDTLVASENIDEFERWGKIRKEHAATYRQVFELYEQLNSLPASRSRQTSLPLNQSEEETLLLIRHAFFGHKEEGQEEDLPESLFTFLRECLKNAGQWYSDAQWGNLRRTDYETNWKLFESVLLQSGLELSIEGPGGERNRLRFGLLNRVIGLSKKSCGKPHMAEGHMEFVIRTVMEKYGIGEEARSARHVLHCLQHRISCFLSTDCNLLDGYGLRKELLKEHPLFSAAHLEIMSPETFRAKHLRGL